VSPRKGARALAIGRAAFGAALLIVPQKVAKGWLGEYAERPAVHALVRSIGVRDVVLGMIALHTLDHPEVGPRWQATCAVVDTIDLLATGEGLALVGDAGLEVRNIEHPPMRAPRIAGYVYLGRAMRP